MSASPSASPGFIDSFRVLGDNLLSSVQDRLALVSLELQEEKLRLIQIVFWISAAVFAGAMALVFGSLALVYCYWENARLAVLGGLTLFYGGGLAVILVAFRAYLKRQPRPFAATLEELEKDRACLHGTT